MKKQLWPESELDHYRPVAETPDDVEGALLRLTDPAYADGKSDPTPSTVDAAEVAATVHTQGDLNIESELELSSLWIFWGQFIDHDIDLTPEQEASESAEFLKGSYGEPFSITRSEFIDGTEPREQPNVITPEIDGSQVYGSTLEKQAELRSFEGGKLRVTENPDGPDLLPINEETGQFEAGDVRAGENTGLTTLHTTFANEHNYWADYLANQHPDWSDEQLFQQARQIVSAEIQKITYTEFLPSLIGDLPEYTGFNLSLEGTAITTEFSTAAFRFGHTAIPENFTFVNEDGSTASESTPLFENFFNPDVIINEGTGSILRGLVEEKSQSIDAYVVDSLNQLLFTPDGIVGFSLPERNILRGEDHGLDTYLNVKAQLGLLGTITPEALAELSASTDFSSITSDPEIQARLAEVYPTLGDVHLWTGIISEDHLPELAIGETGQNILVEQFTRLRDSDPYFYLNQEWTDAGLQETVLDGKLSDILVRSGGVEYVQDDALIASDRQGGTDGNDFLTGDEGRDLLVGFDGKDDLRGRAGDDDLFGGEGKDNLRGGRGDDHLHGEEGKDVLAGGRGDDELEGGDGKDLLTGGRGDDLFVFNFGEEDYDTITDFGRGDDELVIKGVDENDIVSVDKYSNFTDLSVNDTKIARLEGGFEENFVENNITIIGDGHLLDFVLA